MNLKTLFNIFWIFRFWSLDSTFAMQVNHDNRQIRSIWWTHQNFLNNLLELLSHMSLQSMTSFKRSNTVTPKQKRAKDFFSAQCHLCNEYNPEMVSSILYRISVTAAITTKKVKRFSDYNQSLFAAYILSNLNCTLMVPNQQVRPTVSTLVSYSRLNLCKRNRFQSCILLEVNVHTFFSRTSIASRTQTQDTHWGIYIGSEPTRSSEYVPKDLYLINYLLRSSDRELPRYARQID